MEEGILTGDKGLKLDAWARKAGISLGLAKSMSMSLAEPEETPYLLKGITSMFSKQKKAAKEEVRNALLRVQIYCAINSNSDPIRVSKQLFISEVIEKILFGSNTLMTEEMTDEE